MRVVVADATPIHYLIQIEVIRVLPHIFKTILIPIEVRDELSCEAAPLAVKTWIRNAPPWLDILVAPTATSTDSSLDGLDSGERAAIRLAESVRADLLLIDERAGAMLAAQRGIQVTGTLGVLDLASRARLLNLRDAFARLQKTNFRYPPSLIEKLLDEERKRRG